MIYKVVCTHAYTPKSADFAIAHLRVRAFELTPKSQINNNETYADMTNRLLKKQQTGMNSHTRRRLIGLLCFDF